MTHDELIAALEKVTGPDRKLDAATWRHIGLTSSDEAHCVDWCGNGGRTDLTRDRYIAAWARPYTASIDAALTLVPDDACWGVSRPRQPDMSGKQFWASVHGGHPGGRGATPAIALCIAALKARPE